MELVGQNHGFILYRTEVVGPREPLPLDDLPGLKFAEMQGLDEGRVLDERLQPR